MSFKIAHKVACSVFILINCISNTLPAQPAGINVRAAVLIVPAAATVNIPGDLKITSDSVFNNGTIIVSGNLTNNGSVFNNGIITTAGNFINNDSVFNNGIITTAGNFTTNGPCCLASVLGSEIFNGTTIIDGSRLPQFNSIIIKPGATVTANRNIDIKGDWTNNGKFVHGGKTVSFSGTVPLQVIHGTATFYDVILQNAVNFGSSIDTIEHSFSNSAGGMDDGTSRIVFKNNSSIIGSATKFFYDLEILNSAVVNHTTGGGLIHVAHSFINNGILTEKNTYDFYFDSSNATETMSGTGLATFGNLVIGNGSGFSNPTILNCSADFTVTGGSMSFKRNSVYNGNNNTAAFSTANALISGAGTANFYNATTDVALDLGSGISKVNNNLTINAGGSVITNAPLYGSSATLVYNTINANLNTGIEWTGNTGSTGSGAPYNVKIQKADNIVLAGSRTVPGLLSMASSNSLDINGYTLTVNSGFSGTGVLKGSAASKLITAGTGTVYFDAASNLLKTLTVNAGGNLTLGSALSITPGNLMNGYGTVTADGTLTSNGFLTLKSDANGTARVGESSGIIDGDVTVERYVPARRAWRFLSVPFQAGTGTSIKAAWQEGQTSTTLTCPTNDPAPAGYGTHITYNGANGYDLNTTTNASLKVWENNAWVVPPSTITKLITDYSAYCLFVRGDRHICLSNGVGAGSNNTVLRARGMLNQTGAPGVSKNFNAAVAGNFIFIGNPYASSIDISSIISAARSNGIEPDKFWVWDPKMAGDFGVGGYVTFSNGVQVPPGSSTYTAGTIIQSGQAFMVKLNSTAKNATINFQETDKIATESDVFFNKPRPPHPVIYANLVVSSENTLAVIDGVGAAFGYGFSDDVDKKNVVKLWNFNENIALIRNGRPLAIEFRSAAKLTDTLFLRLYLKQQPYKLQLFAANIRRNLPGEVWLVDKYLNTQTEINVADTTLYSFTPNTDTNSYRNRFMLVFNRKEKEVPIATNSISNENVSAKNEKITIYPNPVTGNEVMLHFSNVNKGSYEVIFYNMDGKKLAARKINHGGGNNNYLLPLNPLWQSSAYTLSVINDDAKKLTNLQMMISK